MQTQTPDSRSHVQHKRHQFPWLVGMIMSSVFIIAFVVITLLILRSQGPTQSINTLTILSIVGSFVIGVLSLLFSYLQWRHPRDASPPFVQMPPLGTIEPPHMAVLLNKPQQERIEQNTMALAPIGQTKRRFDWGEAPHVDQLYGRDKEVTTLKQWLVDDHCRLVAILGMGGIGKTGLAATLVDQVHEQYDYVFWRTLYNAPPLESLLQECIHFFSLQMDTALPGERDRQISLLLETFRNHHCLLILDNAESILQGGSQTGHYREGYEEYGRLIQRIGESKHQSCLLITSREKPPEVALLEGEAAKTRSLQLGGLKPADGQGILKDKGLQGTENEWDVLFTHYGGNPLALKLVAQEIHEVFGSTISAFLQDGELFFRNVRDVLEQQMKRLSAREEEIVYWLAIEREAITLSDLQEDIARSLPKGELQEAVSALQRRQLIETSATGVTLHPVIMEYLTDCFVDRISEEMKTERLEFFERYPLLKAQAKDYIRESQRRLILQPLGQRLLISFSKEALEQRFQSLLVTLRAQHDHHSGYAVGNVLNLLIELGCTLRDYDFSHLVVRQAYLQGVDLPGVNFASADLETSVFTDTFGNVICVAFNPSGDLFAVGTATGEIRFWHVSGKPLTTLQGHVDEVRSVAFSSDGKILASGSDDQTVHLWEVSSGKSLVTLQAHTGAVRSVAFSPDGKVLASGSDDQTVRLWEASSGKSLTTLQGHSHWVRSVAFSPDGKTLASGSDDQTVRVWETSSGKLLTTLQGHTGAVYSAAFSPDGRALASGSGDQMVCLWEVSSGKLLNTFLGHSHWVRSVVFSPDGRILASGSYDQTVRVWEISGGQCLTILRGHSHCVRSVAFSPDGKTLASGGDDQTVRVWETSSGKPFVTLQAHTDVIYTLAFSPDGKILASGSGDQTVGLWEVSSGKLLTTLQSHSHWVASVVFSPNGKILASGSNDQTVHLWEISSGKSLATLQAYTGAVYSIAFSPDGRVLASGSDDQTVRLWEISSGKLLTTLQGHSHWIRSVAFSPDGKIFVSGSYDGTIKLWDWQTGTLLQTLRSDRPYERMNITHAKGLTETQKTSLKSLGAIEYEE